MQAFNRAARASGRAIISYRNVLGAVGSAGACVSAVAVHNLHYQIAGASEGARLAFCSASATEAKTVAGDGAGGSGRRGGNHLKSEDVMIYQYKICPFCNKLKAVMDYLGIPHSTTEVNPLTKKELKFSEDYKKVPIVRIGGEVFKDSPVILKELIHRIRREGVMSDEEHAVFCSPDAEKWADWADKQLAVLLFPNLTRNFSESYQAFSYVQDVENFSILDKWANQVLGSTAMWAAQGKIKKKYNIDDEREALYAALKDWTDALERAKGPFMGGDRPNLGDLCVFGCIKAIEGMDTHRDVLSREGVAPWYHRMVTVLEY